MRCCCWFPVPHLCPSKGHQHGVSIETFINLGKTFFPHISHMKCRTDLTLDKPFCMFIFFQNTENLQSFYYYNSIFQSILLQLLMFTKLSMDNPPFGTTRAQMLNMCLSLLSHHSLYWTVRLHSLNVSLWN